MLMAMLVRVRVASACTALVATLAVACGGGAGATSSSARVDRFDADRAFAELRAQVALGPRPAGSAASRTLAERLRRALPGGHLSPVPGGLRNVVGGLPGRGRPILVGAHYDTKDIPGFVGANDGAGGVAVVLELSHALRAGRRPCDRRVRFVLFDGEESPAGSTDFLRDGLRGSRADAAANADRTHAMVLVDFVADRDLSIPREAGSSRPLWARLRASATAVGAGRVFPNRTGRTVLDDHVPYMAAGVPAIDVIDFDYPYFHTPEDTLDKVSPRSLDLVGETLVELLRRMSRETCPRPY